MASILANKGIATRHVDGLSLDRADVKQWFESPGAKAVCNAMLWTEGFDCPSVDCVCVLRPTKSRPLFQQMVGRGTRPSPGKRNLLILDFLWQTEKHRLICRAPQLISKCADTSEIMQRAFDAEAARNGDATEPDLLDAFDGAEHEREKALRAELERQRKKKGKFVDLVDYLLQIGGPDLAQFEPMNKWQAEPVTDGQRATLTKFGVDADALTCRGQASQILDVMIGRSQLNLASPKQIKWLKHFRVPEPEKKTREWATAFLGARFGTKKTEGTKP